MRLVGENMGCSRSLFSNALSRRPAPTRGGLKLTVSAVVSENKFARNVFQTYCKIPRLHLKVSYISYHDPNKVYSDHCHRRTKPIHLSVNIAASFGSESDLAPPSFP